MKIFQAMKTIAAEVFGSYCPICEKQLEGISVCQNCTYLSIIDDNYCQRCGEILTASTRSCGRCSTLLKRFPFDKVRSGFIYNELAKKWLIKIKLHHELHWLSYFRKSIVDTFRNADFPATATLIPVPSSPRKLTERGFNLAWEIAYLIACETGHEICDNLLVQKNDHQDQKQLSKKQRETNSKTHFKKTEGGAPSQIIFIDDVWTTGATLKSCANLFTIKAQVEKPMIFGWTLFRTPFLPQKKGTFSKQLAQLTLIAVLQLHSSSIHHAFAWPTLQDH